MQFIRKLTKKVLDFPQTLANFFYHPNPVKLLQEEFSDLNQLEGEIKELNAKMDKLIIDNEAQSTIEKSEVQPLSDPLDNDVQYAVIDQVYPLLTKKQKEFYIYLNSDQYKNAVKALNTPKYQRLKPGAWLNDEIINDYLKLLEIPTETVILTSFQLDLLNKSDDNKFKRIATRAKLTENTKRILAPYNSYNVHWLSFQIDFDEFAIKIYDSMRKSQYSELTQKLLDLATRIKNGEYTLQIIKCPQQNNMNDCGVFTIKNIAILSKYPSANLNKYYDQSLIFYDRIQICHTLMSQKQ